MTTATVSTAVWRVPGRAVGDAEALEAAFFPHGLYLAAVTFLACHLEDLLKHVRRKYANFFLTDHSSYFFSNILWMFSLFYRIVRDLPTLSAVLKHQVIC